jgi:glycosyltransferase involved in cell wall biosynthesis
MSRNLILLPTFDHQDTLFASIGSVLGQTVEDWRLVVILDGAPPRSLEIVRAFAERDSRITFRDLPKGPRLGEAYRDPIIRESDAERVFQIGDDDLWASDHLATLIGLLEDADFASTVQVEALPSPRPWTAPIAAFATMASPALRRATRENRGCAVGPTGSGYRREAYLALAEGWTTTPAHWKATDWAMTAKFMSHPGLRVAGLMRPTTFKAGAAFRRRWSPAERLAELAAMAAVFQRPDADVVLASAIRYERVYAGWMLSWLDAPPGAGLEEILAHAGTRLVEVETLTAGALHAARPGRAVVAADLSADGDAGLADLLLTPRQREELRRLLAFSVDGAARVAQARVLVEAGRHAEALPLLNDLDACLPQDGEINMLRGLCLNAASSDLDAAEAAFDQAMAGGQDPFWGLFHRATCRRKQGRRPEALADAERLEAMLPGREDVAALRAWILA